MNCPSCGLSGLPFEQACSYCGRALRTPVEALARRREWDRLSESTQAEFAAEAARERERFDRWLRRLRENRRRHAVIAAMMFALPVASFHWMISTGPVYFLAMAGDLAVGAAAGYLLNRFRGGEYRGALVFAAAYVATTFLKFATNAILSPFDLGGSVGLGTFAPAGPALMLLSGLVAMLVAGYLFGLHLTLERSDA